MVNCTVGNPVDDHSYSLDVGECAQQKNILSDDAGGFAENVGGE